MRGLLNQAVVLRRNPLLGFQMGTHPALTISPITYPIVFAACKAILQVRKG